MATSTPVGTQDKILATTMQKWAPKVGLQVYNSTPVLKKVIDNGNKKKWEGEAQRQTIVNATYKAPVRYNNYGTANTTPQEPLTVADFEMAGYMQAVTLSEMQLRKNSSSETKMIDLLATEMQLAMQSMRDAMETDLLATANVTSGLLSLDTITDASTTIGGVGGSSTWGGTTTASGAFTSQGLNDMLTLWQTLSQYADLSGKGGSGITSGDQPDLLITTQAVERSYFNELQPQMRFTGDEKLDTGSALAWFKVPVLSSTYPTSGRLYMINSRHLTLWVHPQADFTMKPAVHPTNQDAWTRLIVWNGALGTSERRKHGKLTGLT